MLVPREHGLVFGGGPRVGRISSAAAAAEALVFIASSDASNDATLDFTGLDSGSYDGYLFVLGNVVPATDAVALLLRTSTDGGTNYDDTAGDYVLNRESRDSSDINNTWPTLGKSETALELAQSFSPGSAAGEDGVSGTIYVLFPHLAKQTFIIWELSYIDSNGDVRLLEGSGIRNSAADVDAVRFLFASGNIESGTITMYGMANS